MDVKKLCSTEKNMEGFYPTPHDLAQAMVQKVDFTYVTTVLEPSAGKGDLAVEILRQMNRKPYDTWQIDTVEIDPNLRSILSHRFTSDGIQDFDPDTFGELLKMEDDLTEVYKDKVMLARYHELKEYVHQLENPENVRIVHDDFLTYRPQFGYDAIIMNPPFSQGAAHLLHAIQLVRHYGGQIVCLLNAETLLNLCTEERTDLARELEKYNAAIDYVSSPFGHAERKTDVNVAIVYLNIQKEKRTSTIFRALEKAQQIKIEKDRKYNELLSTDPIEAAIAMYNMEVKASLHMIDEYWAMSDYLQQKFNGKNEDILWLCVKHGGQTRDLNINSYMRSVRLKYWKALLNNKQFIGLLTSNLQSKYHDMVTDLANYEFSRYNIERIRIEMMSELVVGAKECIMDLFDKLTAQHCYNINVQNGNIHYYNGWMTNKAYKLDKKCIIPTYGLYSQWFNKFEFYAVYSLLADMEKALNYLDGGLTQEVKLESTLKEALNSGQTRNIHLKYFDISLYKKGTAHIVFNNPELIDRFNIFASQQKGWLPPSYGKKEYDEMTPDEQSVIDSFQGADAYNKVLMQPEKYLFSAEQILALAA